jgi:regulator of Ty1 transposition protein 103
MEVSAQTLADKLQKLSNTQVAIEGVSGYLLLYRKHARSVVHVWDAEFYKSGTEKRLTLLYLANHVLQEGRKKGREYMDEFARVLPKAMRALFKGGDEKTKKSIARLISLWSERNVFNPVNIKQMRDAVGGSSGAAGGEPVSQQQSPAPCPSRAGRCPAAGPVPAAA